LAFANLFFFFNHLNQLCTNKIFREFQEHKRKGGKQNAAVKFKIKTK
jgi:hypothetical protein